MSTNEPPPGNPGDQPPFQPPAEGGAPPPAQPPPPASPPPPAPPAGGYSAPPMAGGYVAPPTPGVPRPGELMDRFLARLIDGVLIGIVYGILFGIFLAILVSDRTYNFNKGEYEGGSTILFGIVFGIVAGVIGIVYYAFMESTRGATIGKQLMKLKVVGPDGVSNPTLEQAVKRNIFTAAPIAYIVPFVGPAIAGLATLVGEIMIAVGINGDPVKRQGWHDKFAGGTSVLKIG